MKPRAFPAQRPLVVLAICYALGVLAGRAWEGFQFPLPLAGLFCALMAALLFRQHASLRMAAAGFIFLFLGLLLSGIAAHPALPGEGSYLVNARVSGESEWREEDGRVKALLRDVRLVDGDGNTTWLSGAYWTYYPEKGSPLPLDGQEARFSGSLYHPDGQVNPYGFDFRLYLLQRGVTAGISGSRELLFTPETTREPQSPWLRLRNDLSDRLDALFGEDSGLPKALLLGERSDLKEETTSDFRDAGIAHVLAVSGLHVGLLMAGAFFILRFFHLSPGMLLIIIAALLLFYCRLLDFAPSVVRAVILTLLFLLGKVFRRRVDPLTSLACAFLLILFFRPLDLFSLGFQLSFLAVLGIITVGDRLNALSEGSGRFQRLPAWVKGVVKAYFVTFSASVMTAIPLINTFHAFSLVGLLVGPPAILLIGFLMTGYIVPLLLSFISLPVSGFLAQPALALSRIYQAGAAYAAGLPGAFLRLPRVPLLTALLFFSLLLLMTRYVRMKRITRLLCAGGAACLITALSLVPQHDSVRYVQLSAGSADSAVLMDGEETWVIDTGEHGGDLSNMLLSEGRAIDKLILTHLHSDHAGGLRQLMDNRVTIREILLPWGAADADITDDSLDLLGEAQAAGIPVGSLGAGDAFSSSRVNAKVLWPERGDFYPGQDPNRGSLVLLLDLDGVSLLTCGDISADYAAYAAQPAQVLKAPHHGAKANMAASLLNRVSPQLSLITASDARPDRYQAALERLDARGAASLVTGERGALTLSVLGGQLQVRSYLQKGE